MGQHYKAMGNPWATHGQYEQYERPKYEVVGFCMVGQLGNFLLLAVVLPQIESFG